LFARKPPAPAPEPPKTGGGKQALRQALATRFKKRENLISLSRSLEIPNAALEAFAFGGDELDNRALSEIADFLWPGREYDPDTDTLRRKDRAEPAPIGVLPPPAVGRTVEEILGPERSFASLASGTGAYKKPAGWD
jgi:hypothetical protein